MKTMRPSIDDGPPPNYATTLALNAPPREGNNKDDGDAEKGNRGLKWKPRGEEWLPNAFWNRLLPRSWGKHDPQLQHQHHHQYQRP